jgi:hypothetical protein
MKEVEVFYFFQPPPPGTRKKPQRTRWKMTIENGKKRFPTGWPDLLSREVRRVLDSEDEISAAMAASPSSSSSGPATEASIARSLQDYNARMRKGDGN